MKNIETFFENDKKTPLQVIDENIGKIFDENYQKSMFKKQEVEGSFQRLSNKAENFLRRLIVKDPEERYGWKQLF